MVKEKILNSFISSNMQSLGLHHVNSEVPKVVAEHVGKRTDILGFDLATSIPIILELKVKKDSEVVSQLQDYIALVSKKYPNLFEELNAFRRLEGFQFNFRQGIVGMVLSPEPPSESIADRGSTILWAQFSLSNDGVFRILSRKLLSKSTSFASAFDNRPPFQDVLPSQFVSSTLPKLRKFADRLNETYLSVSPTINPRSKYGHSHIAYYGTDTTRVIFGFNTGPARSFLDVEFSVYENNHGEFLSHPATKKLSALGLRLDQPRKNQIFPVRVEEQFAGDDNKVSQALGLFKEMAELSYGFATVPELQTLQIEQSSVNGLSLKSFGII
jgi:hypothetical protein